MDRKEDTNQFLAIRYPNIRNPRRLLQKFDKAMEIFKLWNGGNVESRTRWSLCGEQWTDWTIRDLTRDE